MEFEFDQDKSQANKQKHGIDFVEAQALWLGEFLQVEIKYETEPRWMIVGKIENKYWTAVVTLREDRVRIISVRRARDEEKKRFERK